MRKAMALMLGLGTGLAVGGLALTAVRRCAAEPAEPGTRQPPVVAADASGSTREGVAAVVDGSNAFAFELYAALKAEAGNVFFSPSSISTALAMVFEGARGDTAAEMQRVFHFPEDTLVRQSAFAGLHNALNPKESRYQLSVANGIWTQRDYGVLPDYLEIVRRRYGGEAASMDFVAAPEPSREAINAWVEDRTRDRIKDLFPEGSINPMTRLVLANAIYFKGRWATPFEEDATEDLPFRSPAGEAVVPTMFSVDDFEYFENDLLQSLELPYQASELDMQVLLPKVDDLAALEAALSPALLEEISRGRRHEEVHTWLPRFTFESKYMLGDTLAALGMPLAFTPGGADFSGMDGSRDLFISQVIHQGFVEVNEEGTEAAAATGVVMETTAAPAEPPRQIHFRADHPFIFLIRHNETGAILFMGRVEEPE